MRMAWLNNAGNGHECLLMWGCSHGPCQSLRSYMLCVSHRHMINYVSHCRDLLKVKVEQKISELLLMLSLLCMFTYWACIDYVKAIFTNSK